MLALIVPRCISYWKAKQITILLTAGITIYIKHIDTPELLLVVVYILIYILIYEILSVYQKNEKYKIFWFVVSEHNSTSGLYVVRIFQLRYHRE